MFDVEGEKDDEPEVVDSTAVAESDAESTTVAAPEVVAAAEPDGSDELEAKGEAAPDASATPAEKEDWRDKRIAKLTAQLRAKVAAAAPQGAAEATEDFEARVEREVEARTSSNSYLAKMNEVAAKARETFGGQEFNARLADLQQVVDATDPAEVRAYQTFLEIGLETGELGKLIFLLGADKNRAAEVMAMSPAKMAVELTKMATKVEVGEEVSALPKPITPVEPRGRGAAIDPSDPDRADKLTTAEWMRRRNEQLASASGRK